MATFDDAASGRINGARAACNTLLWQHPVTTEDRSAVWRAEDIFAIQEALFPCDGLSDAADRAACFSGCDQILHLTSQQNMICVQDLGPEGDRIAANLIDDACEDEFLSGTPHAEGKCDALYRFYERRAASPDFFSGEGVVYYGKEGAKWGAIGVAGGYAAGWGFAHAAELLKKLKGKGGPAAAIIVGIIGGVVTYSEEASAAPVRVAGEEVPEKSWYDSAMGILSYAFTETVCGLLLGCGEAY